MTNAFGIAWAKGAGHVRIRFGHLDLDTAPPGARYITDHGVSVGRDDVANPDDVMRWFDDAVMLIGEDVHIKTVAGEWRVLGEDNE